MADVVFIPDNSEKEHRLLKQTLAATIHSHPDRAIAERWDEMAQVSINRFPGPPKPPVSPLDLSEVGRLTEAEKAELMARVEHYLAGYVQDVRDQLLRMHSDMWRLQKRIAELESEEITQLKL